MKLEVVKLSDYNLVEFIELVNCIFEDYLIPIKWDVYNFELDARENSISFDDSFIFLEDGSPISFVLLCLRKNRARIDAMGVVKEKRGMGVGNYMIEYVIEKLRWKGVNSIVLEVIENDEKTIKFYMKNKFRHLRKLLSLIREDLPSEHKWNYVKSNNTRIYGLSANAEKIFRRRLNWQREPLTLMLSEDRYDMREVKHKGKVLGYLVWGEKEDGTFIVDCAPSDPSVSFADILEDSLKYIKDMTNTKFVQLMNLPEDDPLNDAAKMMNFSKFIGQFEMERRIR